MAILKITNGTQQAAQALGQKLGDDEAATVLLATIMAAFQQTILLYEDSEARHGAILDGASSFLRRLGTSMTALEAELEATDQAVAELHGKVKAKLLSATDNVVYARRAMSDVLKIYNDFAGNTEQLKQGVAALAKSTLTSMNPALGFWAGPQIDKLLKIA